MRKIHRCRVGFYLFAATFTHFVNAHEMPEIFSASRIEADVGKTGNRSVESWHADGWIGSDINRFAWKTEGDVEAGNIYDSEAQLLYSRYVAPFWDFQIGARHDFDPAAHNYFAIGMRGLAPYGFDIDVAAFLRDDGKWVARTRAEYELLITNRFIVEPYAFGDWATASDRNDEIKGGLYSLETGLKARYEFTRTFAPYVEIARVEHPAADTDENYTIARLGVRLLF